MDNILIDEPQVENIKNCDNPEDNIESEQELGTSARKDIVTLSILLTLAFIASMFLVPRLDDDGGWKNQPAGKIVQCIKENPQYLANSTKTDTHIKFEFDVDDPSSEKAIDCMANAVELSSSEREQIDLSASGIVRSDVDNSVIVRWSIVDGKVLGYFSRLVK